MKHIAIIGGGASSVLLALNVARKTSSSLEITIIEPREVLGEGIAYSTKDEGHVLNVPAGRMSAFMDQPEHFMNWAGCDKNTFVARKIYAQYLQKSLESLTKGKIELKHLQDRAESLGQLEGKWKIQLKSGETLLSDAAVLAIGHGESFDFQGAEAVENSPNYLADPWREAPSQRDGHLIAIGTGLTFIDHALSHIRRNPSNVVTGISRNGLLPEPHLAHRSDPLVVPDAAKQSPALMRQFIEEANDWRAAQDGVRHQLPEIWQGWSDAYKTKFLAEDLRWWNVHRHRLAPEIAEEVMSALHSGQIRVKKDEVSKAEVLGDGIQIELKSGESLQGDVLVNCLGYKVAGKGSLVETLVKSGLAVEGPLGLGIRTNYPLFNLLDERKQVIKNLFALGPVLFGERFETTAIPELREQADVIAEQLLQI